MKREQEVFEHREMVPINRSSKAWSMYSMDDAMEVDSIPAPRPPPPGAKPGKWNSDGEWVEGGSKARPPPPPPLPPTSQHEKKAFQTMTKEDRQDYSKLASLENLTEDDPIPSWALEMDAPKSPIVYDPETSFAESKPLKEHESFDGHATIKKGTPCHLCLEVTFFSGLAWTYCKAGPPIPGAN
eukprot:1794857-Amphidinium_carterae.2